ncbi:MAG TPA: hypothetical protein VHB48_16965 [Chitinophagaceae bacterium]|nr:hypothetical protein [Chitinophagaceae bacterium]
MQKISLAILCTGLFLSACNNSTNKNHTGDSSATKTDSTDFEKTSLGGLVKGTFTEADSLADLPVKGYTIKRLSGKDKYGSYTKIEYKNTLQLVNEAREEAKKTMQSEYELNSNLDMYRDFDQGGEITMNIGRITLSSADLKYFEIIIKDTSDSKELFRGGFDSNIPETPISNDVWRNIGIKSVTVKIRPPFYVYVSDHLDDVLFKFLVTPKK